MTGSLHAGRWRRQAGLPSWRQPDDGFSTWTDRLGPAAGSSTIRVHAIGRCRELPELVFLPGLGAPGYLVPLLRAVAGWTRATVLELPGWRRGRAWSCPPTVAGIGTALGCWLEATGRRNVVLIGHSTGAQAVLQAALRHRSSLVGIVLAGPTFAPAARTVPGLLRALGTTLPRERPGELLTVLPDYLRSGGLPLLRLLRSGMADRMEERVDDLAVPLLVLTGRADRLADPAWARRLAGIGAGDWAALPGAHNFCYSHPAPAAELLRQTVGRWAAPARPDGPE
jgi:pimeloyl-ACP methyl ester carboxylesterase